MALRFEDVLGEALEVQDAAVEVAEQLGCRLEVARAVVVGVLTQLSFYADPQPDSHLYRVSDAVVQAVVGQLSLCVVLQEVGLLFEHPSGDFYEVSWPEGWVPLSEE